VQVENGVTQLNGNRTVRRQTNLQSVNSWHGQLTEWSSWISKG